MRLETMGAVALVAMLTACGGDKGEVTPTGETGDTDTTDTDTTTDCTSNAVKERYPADGQSGIYVRSAVDIIVAQPDTTATIIVTDSEGTEVPGTVSLHDGDRRVQFLPSAPYALGEEYTSTLQWNCPDRVETFTAGGDGADPIGDTSGLVGRGYSLDLKDGRFVAPEGIGAALEDLLEVKLLLGVHAADATSISLRAGALDANGDQDTAATTTDFDDPASFEDPFFSVSQNVLPLVVEGDPIDVDDLVVSGSFVPGGTEIVGFRLSGIVDTRDLKAAVGVPGDEDVCNLFGASFDIDCEDCPGGGEYCITLVVADIPLPETGFTVEVVP